MGLGEVKEASEGSVGGRGKEGNAGVNGGGRFDGECCWSRGWRSEGRRRAWGGAGERARTGEGRVRGLGQD